MKIILDLMKVLWLTVYASVEKEHVNTQEMDVLGENLYLAYALDHLTESAAFNVKYFISPKVIIQKFYN